jgi:GntR family transcriptional regulator
VFSINYRDARPIYEQVKDGLRVAILTGAMQKDEKCPSVRELAGQLAINPNTIQKAYRELEAEGYIYSVPGKGNFVSECREAMSLRKTELYAKLDGTVTELMHVGETADSISAHIRNFASREART